MTWHPTLEELRAFSVGSLPDEPSEQIETHLDSCDRCNELLEDIAADDPLENFLRQGEMETLFETSKDVRAATQGTPEQIGDYRIIGELGRGGMAAVFRAEHQQLKRSVALKVILAGSYANPDVRQRFLKEAEVIAQLRHPGIVQIYEVGEHDGQVFLALELMPGNSLQSLTGDQPQDVKWSAAMVLQLAEAIEVAHQHGIVHRDLKPDNVLLEHLPGETPGADDTVMEAVGGRRSDSASSRKYSTGISPEFETAIPSVPIAKIADFGLARQSDSESDLTQSGAIMGTPAYMAPEQATGQSREAGPAADVYALGGILYKLLTGRPPFVADDIMSIVAMAAHDDPTGPRQLRRDVPKPLETICMKCLMKRPEDRYASAQELADDLRLYLQGEPILASPLGVVGRTVRWARRNPVLAIAYPGMLWMYLMHLFAMLVLEAPSHQGAMHWAVTGATAATFVFMQCVARLPSTGRWELIHSCLIAWYVPLIASIVFVFDRGPQSAPVPIYLLLVSVSGLINARPFVIWSTTAVSAISYLIMTAVTSQYAPQHMVTPEDTGAFVMCILSTGLVTWLLLHRSRRGLRAENPSSSNTTNPYQ